MGAHRHIEHPMGKRQVYRSRRMLTRRTSVGMDTLEDVTNGSGDRTT